MARTRQVCGLVVGAYAVLIALLVGVIYLEDRSILLPLVVLSVAGLAVAAVVLTLKARWTLWLATVYSAVTLLADGPHQVPELVHPTSVVHTVGATLLLLAGVAALLVSFRVATSTSLRSTSGHEITLPMPSEGS